jgi:electron transfer flavoprotein alpha subunit
MGTILVIAEHEAGTFKKTAAELLGKARELGAALNLTVVAGVLGDAPAAQLGGLGATEVWQVPGDFTSYGSSRATDALAALVAASGASAVLCASSYLGKDAVPRVVARLGSGMASECTDLRVVDGQIVGRRPLYAGKAFADVRVSRGPAFFTVRPNSFPAPLPTGATAQVHALPALPADPVTVIERRAAAAATADLTEAERIVSGGRSLRSAEQFDALVRPLAAAFGATVGASRAAVDAGYAHHDEQVGQTGKTVNPSLYVAVGISGAIQHLAGMRTSKVIVAINKDADAPIFEHATYGVVGDLFEICPRLTEAVRAARA